MWGFFKYKTKQSWRNKSIDGKEESERKHSREHYDITASPRIAV